MGQFVGNIFVSDTTTTAAPSTSQPTEFLLKVNNLSDIPDRNEARQNLGITVSTQPPGGPKLNDLWVDLDS